MSETGRERGKREGVCEREGQREGKKGGISGRARERKGGRIPRSAHGRAGRHVPHKQLRVLAADGEDVGRLRIPAKAGAEHLREGKGGVY